MPKNSMSSTLLGPNDFVVMPWKNGNGSTTELICEQALDGSGFLWRLSIASVVEDGFFSDFGGYERTLILLSGNGLTLDHEKQARLINRYEFCEFSGGSKTHATLHDGPITDFNIMCREGRFRARPPKIVGDEKIEVVCDAEHQFFYAAETGCSWSVEGSEQETMQIGSLLHVGTSTVESIWVTGPGLICIQVVAISA